MSTPVVVQGTAVQPPFGGSPQPAGDFGGATQPHGGNGDNEATRTGCKDPIFALLFYGNVIAMAAVAAVYGPAAFDETEQSATYDAYLVTVTVTAVIALLFSGLGLLVMMKFPETIIKASLLFVVAMSLVWCIISFMAGQIIAGVFGLIFFAIGVCYARAVWSRIPFATINLITGITAIQANFGVTTFAYLFAALGVGWSILWGIAFAGVFEYTYECDAFGNCSDPNYGFMFLLFLSFFFTHQVLQNSVHVTVAGTVGTWWVAPEENGCCGKAVWNSFIRTITTSFGSICFGSLLVAILQALKALANQAQAEGDAGILACIAECIISCLASILEYFNKWAFIYVGVYGYGYLEAGKNVFELFRNRGWEAVIADDLVGNALFLVSVIVGGLMGVVGIILEATTDWFEDAGGDATLVAFLLGFIVGLAVSSILLSTIASAVNCVIVMFADAPGDLQQNHPELSQRMRDTWSTIYPGSV